MGLLLRGIGWFWRRYADYNTAVSLLDLLDLKTAVAGCVAWVATLIYGATNSAWSSQKVVVAAFIVAACVAIIVVACRFISLPRHSAQRSPISAPSLAQVEDNLAADIDASEAFYRVMTGSAWRDEQIRSTPDTSNKISNWLEKRLDTEIHKALVNDRLKSWGEEVRPNGTDAPERPIPADKWVEIEIDFRPSGPGRRTIAIQKVVRPNTGKVAWAGIKFNSVQFFRLFRSNAVDNWRPIFEAVGHVANCIGDTNTKEYWPKARLDIRQHALDKKILIRGRKSAKIMGGGLIWSEVETDIANTYWEGADLHITAAAAEAGDSPQTFPHQFSSGLFGDSQIYLYTKLRVNWPEILQEWPSR